MMSLSRTGFSLFSFGFSAFQTEPWSHPVVFAVTNTTAKVKIKGTQAEAYAT
jgi:hypothetical protein